MPSWLTGIGLKLAAVGAAILAFLALILRLQTKAEQAGAAKVEAADAKATTDAVKEAADVHTEVEKKPEGAAQAELQKDWSRG